MKRTFDAAYIEYTALKNDMSGISPKVSIYKEMETRLVILKRELDSFHALSPVDKNKTVV